MIRAPQRANFSIKKAAMNDYDPKNPPDAPNSAEEIERIKLAGGFCLVGGKIIPEGQYGEVAGECYFCGVGAMLLDQGPAPCPHGIL